MKTKTANRCEIQQGFPEDASKSTKAYLEELHQQIMKTREIVMQHSEKVQNRQKYYYDQTARAVKVFVGDKVLVRRLTFDGKDKISDKFEEDIYTVKEQPCIDIPVFKVESEKSGIVKTIHRNHLLPVNHSGAYDIEETTPKLVEKPDVQSESLDKLENEVEDLKEMEADHQTNEVKEQECKEVGKGDV